MVGKRRRVVENTTGNVRPLSDRILVEMEERPTEKMTDGGICLPPSVEEDRVCARGTIKAVGPGVQNKDGEFIPLDCKVGQFILFGKYAGTEVKIFDTEHRIMNFADILAVLEEPEDVPQDSDDSN
jgi:chaperonin GroES